MRSLRLARIAAEAEGLRLRTQIQRAVTRIALLVIALVFLTGALVFLHVAAWYWLRLDHGWGQMGTALVVMAGDLVLAGILVVLASRSQPSRVELEAMAVRARALEAASSSMAVSAMLVPALRLGLGLARRRR